jgi:hypothetical protein
VLSDVSKFILLYPSNLENKGSIFSFEISGNTNPATQHHIPEQLNIQQHMWKPHIWQNIAYLRTKPQLQMKIYKPTVNY